MSTIQLRPMTATEYVDFHAAFVAAWADDLAQLDDLDAATATHEAIARTAASLPEGVDTAGHRLFTIVTADRAVGSLWMSLDDDGAFLQEVTIDPTLRGQGLGRQAMACAEEVARAAGSPHLTLNVYQHNPRALALYEALGYATLKRTMRKRL